MGIAWASCRMATGTVEYCRGRTARRQLPDSLMRSSGRSRSWLAWLENHNRQWRDREVQGMEPAVRGQGDRLEAAEVAVTAAAVFQGVTVEDLLPEAAARSAQAIIVARHRRE